MAANSEPTASVEAADAGCASAPDAAALPGAALPESGRPCPFDVPAVIELCMGQAAFAGSLIQSFQDDSEANLDKLSRYALLGDAQAAADVAHAIKGSAAIVSAAAVRRVAAEIQEAGEQADIDRVRQLIDNLHRQIETCRRYLPTVQALVCGERANPSDEQDS